MKKYMVAHVRKIKSFWVEADGKEYESAEEAASAIAKEVQWNIAKNFPSGDSKRFWEIHEIDSEANTRRVIMDVRIPFEWP